MLVTKWAQNCNKILDYDEEHKVAVSEELIEFITTISHDFKVIEKRIFYQ